MSEREQLVKVEIYDRVYQLRSAADEKYTKNLAKSVDTVMRTIADKSQTVESLRVAVLAALHFADRYERLKERYDRLNGMVSEKSVEFREALDTLRKTRHGAA